MCTDRVLCDRVKGEVVNRAYEYALTLDMEWLRYDKQGLFVKVLEKSLSSYGLDQAQCVADEVASASTWQYSDCSGAVPQCNGTWEVVPCSVTTVILGKRNDSLGEC